MNTAQFRVPSPTSLHGRSAFSFQSMLTKIPDEVYIEKNHRQANGKSLLGLLSLGVAAGDPITVTIIGNSADQNAEMIQNMLRRV